MIFFAHFTILLLSSLHFGECNPTPGAAPPQEPQYVHEKEEQHKPEPMMDEQEHYRLTNNFKPEQPPSPPPFMPWNPFRPQDDLIRSNRLYNMLGYGNSIMVPYPVIVPQDLFYGYQGGDDYDDPMSRANVRRPTYRNSPIYYVRLPPTPYMFVPGLGYTSQPPSFAPNYSPIVHYNQFPAIPYQQAAISPLLNLPINFLTNGKPSNIYTLDAGSLQSPAYQPQAYQPPAYQPPAYQPQAYQPFFPPPPRPQYRPQYVASAPPPPQNYLPDSKITHLKRPYIFNGRPMDDIYVLQNSFNPIYQTPLQAYY